MKVNPTVGYVPYSNDLSHPGDRRRLNSWATNIGIELNTTSPLDSDILVLSNNANFNYWLARSKVPTIIDLVDGYLGETPNLTRDILRNVVRSFKGKSQFHSITYTRALKEACRRASAVIVASEEQRIDVLKFNSNVYVIPDNLSELNSYLDKASFNTKKRRNIIFWEGYGFTLKHFAQLSLELDTFLVDNDFELALVTNLKFARWGGYIGKIDTAKLVKKMFPSSSSRIIIVPWTLDNLFEFASKSKFAIIPINARDKFAYLKPENKLISMWRLGLPTIFSPIPSYVRVSDEANLSEYCVNQDDWLERLDWVANFNDNEFWEKSLSEINTNYSEQVILSKWNEVITLEIKN
jgi:hypothetical protein